MKIATIQSRCECQASLFAELDENRFVRRGWAKDTRRRKEEPSPAHSIGADDTHFEVGWHCPFCIRNVLRAFEASGLAWTEVPDPEPEASADSE